MINIRTSQSDYVKFSLKSELFDAFFLDSEPVGWDDNGISFTRHSSYHGIMTSFTGDLVFHGKARDYILNDFETLGINSLMKLNKYELEDVDGVIKWNLVYTGIVDYSTYSDEDKAFSVKFNSNDLEELLKTREDDEFELESIEDINGNQIDALETNLTDLSGVSLTGSTSLTVDTDVYLDGGDWAEGKGTYQLLTLKPFGYHTPILKMDLDTSDRISTPDVNDPSADLASKMFFVDSTDPNVDKETDLSLSFNYKIDLDIQPYNAIDGLRYTVRDCSIILAKYIRNEETYDYDLVDFSILKKIKTSNTWENLKAEGYKKIENIKWNEGLIMYIDIQGYSDISTPFVSATDTAKFESKINEWTINISSNSDRSTSEDCEFLFAFDCFNRLLNIITGKKNKFISRLFGRTEIGYKNDGEYGLIGIISGLWARQFNNNYSIYKSMILSFSDLYDSLDAVFNIGLGIELIDGEQKIVIERKDFFYQNSVVIKLDGDVSNYNKEIIKDDFFSTLEFGYDKGGDYDSVAGLDEPNVKTTRITPINRNKKTYRKVSKIRADDTGLEIIRRKPAKYYPTEDTSQDDNNWFLDLKRDIINNKYVQSEWYDRLKFKPSGLSFADSFKGFLFTPLSMLFRHGYIIRSGLNQTINLAKKIIVSSSESNQTLEMWPNEKEKSYKEGDYIYVEDLDYPKTEPFLISFNYTINKDLIKKVLGKTSIYYNGEKILVPNYYFKFEWTDYDGNKVRGYLNNMEPSSNTLEFILANDIINK